MSVYAYISDSRPDHRPEPPLFYARPDTWERFRYLVLAEQFRDLFSPLRRPVRRLRAEVADATGVLSRQFMVPAGCWPRSAPRSWPRATCGRSLFMLLLVLPNVIYSMNFRDGDIDRYYMLDRAGRRDHDRRGSQRRGGDRGARHGRCQPPLLRLPGPPARGDRHRRAAARAPPPCCPRRPAGPATGAHEQSANRDADAWVASVHDVLPPNAVVDQLVELQHAALVPPLGPRASGRT